MTTQRMDHVSIVVDDLAAATEFFVELGFVLHVGAPVEGSRVDRVVGLEGVRAHLAMLEAPDGNARRELVKFHSPPSQSHDGDAPRYEDRYRLCYVRGPEAVIIELAERIG
jgi:hypothetical protein